MNLEAFSPCGMHKRTFQASFLPSADHLQRELN